MGRSNYFNLFNGPRTDMFYSSYILELDDMAMRKYEDNKKEEKENKDGDPKDDMTSDDIKKAYTVDYVMSHILGYSNYGDEDDWYSTSSKWDYTKSDIMKLLKKHSRAVYTEIQSLKNDIKSEIASIINKFAKDYKFCKKCESSKNFGFRECSTCKGMCSVECKECKGNSGSCEDCNERGTLKCPECMGIGKSNIGSYSVRYRFIKNLVEEGQVATDRYMLKKYKSMINELEEACQEIDRKLSKYGYDSDFEFHMTHGNRQIYLIFVIENIEDKDFLKNLKTIQSYENN